MESRVQRLYRKPVRSPHRAVFYSVAAQEDNLGDIAIRRSVLAWVADSGRPIHIFLGTMPRAYLDALRLPSGVTLHDTRQSFTTAWLQSSMHRQAALVYAPGPRVAVSTIAATRSAAEMLFMTGITRSAGGKVLGVGGAIRGRRSLALKLHQITAWLSTDYSVRDEISRGMIETHSRLIPDVAFADSQPVDKTPPDPLLVLSIRFDRLVDYAATRALVREASKEGLRPVLLTQVRRDQENHQRLANDLGIDLCGWTDETHEEQLERVDETFRSAAAVFSDRLHACIFGARHGAVVVNAETSDSRKLASTLSTVYPNEVLSTTPQSGSAQPLLDDLQVRRERQNIFTRRASLILDGERLRLAEALSDPITYTEARSQLQQART